MADETDEIADWGRRMGVTVLAFQQEFVKEMGRALVMATPVDTGRLRGSWTITLGDAPAPETAVMPPDPEGSATVERMSAIASQLAINQQVYYDNVCRYQHYVEYGTKYMAPRPFVRTTLARAEEIGMMVLRRLRAAKGIVDE